MQSLIGAVILSRGSVWKPHPMTDPPYLHPNNNGVQVWPDGAYCFARFTDSSGDLIIDDLELPIQPDGIYPRGDAEEMDLIPNGANFEIYIDHQGDVEQIRHGNVLRREAFYATPPSKAAIPPQAFSDSFQRDALGNKWKPVTGRTKIYDHSALDLPNGVCVDGIWDQKSSIRYVREFTGDAIEVRVRVVNPWSSQNGKSGFIVCADINLTTGLVMQLETSVGNKKLHLGTLSGPNAIVDRITPVANTVANLDDYLIRVTGDGTVLSPMVTSVYKGDSLSPMARWTDEAAIVPHGRGYRHMGMNFDAALLNSGVRVVSCAARDAV